MRARALPVAAVILLTACGRKIDGVLYSTMDGGGKRIAASEVVAVPANGRTREALAKFCRDQKQRGADSDSLRAQLERRSAELAGEAEVERARNGWSRRWKQLMGESTAFSDSARAVPMEALSSSSGVAKELAVARATTNPNGEFHLAGVPMGKYLLVSTADDDWGDVISVGLFGGTRADVNTEVAMPGCALGSDFRR